MKPIIGILSNQKTDEKEGVFKDYYKVNEIYVEKLKASGGNTIGILDTDEEILEKCDGFLLIGGHRINENHYKIIEHAIKNNKPLLGICNGMQAIVMYANLCKACLEDNMETTIPNLYKKYDELKEKNTYFLQKLDNHGTELSQRKIELSEENVNKYRHKINILPGSILGKIYGSTANVASIHTYGIYEVPDTLEVIARTSDNVVEAIQYRNKNIIGIQFHAELDDNLALFEYLVESSR